MQKDEKKQIAARLKEYCAQKGSQNKAANSMNGVSSATISKVLSDIQGPNLKEGCNVIKRRL